MYRATDAGRVNLSNVKSEPIIGASRPWGGSFQERVGRFASVGIIRPKYRRPKPNTLFGNLLYEYDRNQSAYLTTYTIPRARDETQQLVLPPVEPRQFSSASVMVAWICLLVGVIATSCVGSFIQKMAGANGLIKSIWFGEGLCVLFVVSTLMNSLAQRLTFRPGGYKTTSVDTGYVFSATGLGLLLLAGIGSGIGSGCWTLSLNYTSVAQSYLFNSLHPQLILLARISQLLPVFWEEVLGIMLALGGCALAFYGSQASSSSSGGKDVLLGDALAFISSISQAGGLLVSKFLLPHMTSGHYLSIVTFGALVVQLLAAGALLRDQLSLFGPTDGVFGFLDEAYFPWWLGCIVCFGISQFGIMTSLGVLSPIVVSIMLTLQPFLATAIQVLVLRAGAWPPPLSLLGNLVLVAGSFMVCWASRYHTVQDEIEMDSEDEDEEPPREGG